MMQSVVSKKIEARDFVDVVQLKSGVVLIGRNLQL